MRKLHQRNHPYEVLEGLFGTVVVCALAGLLLSGGVAPLFAQSQSLTISKNPNEPDEIVSLPPGLEDVGFDQKLGDPLPLELEFQDASGETVTLGSLLGDKPVLFAPVYYDCPMLCSLVLDGVVRGLKPLSIEPGTDFDVVALSFDPREGPQHAREDRDLVMSVYDRPETAGGWNFLVGSEENTRAVMDSIGFRYQFNEATGLYAHAGGVVLLTPEGEISRYFFGVDYAPKDLRLGLVEASAGEIGNVIDQLLLFCYQYDPAVGKYSAYAMGLVRLGGVLILIILGIFLISMWRMERRRSRELAKRGDGPDLKQPVTESS